jgi:hypothetical protein
MRRSHIVNKFAIVVSILCPTHYLVKIGIPIEIWDWICDGVITAIALFKSYINQTITCNWKNLLFEYTFSFAA